MRTSIPRIGRSARDGLDGDDDALVQYVVVLDVGPHGQRSGGSAAVEEHGGVRHPLHGQLLLVEVVDKGAQRSLGRLAPSGH